MLSQKNFSRFAWSVLALNLLVIVWGVVVRATGAGAGCGEHWPLCNGAVIPPAPQIKTLIEYGHRVTSGIALLFVAGLVFFAFRSYPNGHVVRRMAALSVFFELMEAVIGAGLVLLGHVAGNTSINRGYSLTLHLVNTLLLLAALSLTAWYSGRIRNTAIPKPRLRLILALTAAGLLLVAISGGIAALGDTLFASHTLAEGFQQDFSSASHPFVRLRILHPILATLLGLLLIGLAAYTVSAAGTAETPRRLGIGLILVVILQLCLGVVNLLLMAPVPIQLAHLFLADILWITFTLLAVELLSPTEPGAKAGSKFLKDDYDYGVAHSGVLQHQKGNPDSAVTY